MATSVMQPARPALPVPAMGDGAGTRRSTLRVSPETGIAIAIVFIIALLIVPLAPAILDFFLATSLGLSLVVLLTAIQTTDALEFSSFPALLLLLTLFRLALNVSSARLILTRGEAGHVIQAFGEFV